MLTRRALLELATVGAAAAAVPPAGPDRSEEHTSELQSLRQLVCRLLLVKQIRIGTHAVQWFFLLKCSLLFQEHGGLVRGRRAMVQSHAPRNNHREPLRDFFF